MDIRRAVEALHRIIKARQKANAIWGYQGDEGVIEPTCLALLALRRGPATDVVRAVQTLLHLQNADGSWSAFVGDEPEGCWTTALVAVALMAAGCKPASLTPAIKWLLNVKGRESNWFWRWKFQTVDNKVHFDPAKCGWNWVPGTTSWVIPTAFSLIALRQSGKRGFNGTAELAGRIQIGTSMLLDRMCPGGGWNAGNGVAFGMSYAPYIDATAIALLALAGHVKEPRVHASLAWLVNRLPGCPSPYSLAWGILALAAYRDTSSEVRRTLVQATKELAALIGKAVGTDDICTLAACALAFEATEGNNVFEVQA